MKKQITFLSALAIFAFASCEKTPEPANQEKNDQVELTMKLGKYGASKAIGIPATESQITVGPSFSVESFVGATSHGSNYVDFVKVGETNVYSATAKVNSEASSVKLVGNYDGTLVEGVTLSENVNTRQGDISKPVVLVSGTGTVIKGAPNRAEVNVTPEMARIEITPAFDEFVSKPTNIRNVTIEAVMLNNTKILRNGIVDKTSSNNFKSTFSPSGNKYKLFDYAVSEVRSPEYTRSSPPIVPDLVLGWPVVDHNGNALINALNGKAIGYNIFPQEGASTTELAKAKHPHIIVLISYEENKDSEWQKVTSGYLNITAFNSASGYITSFDAGSIYTFSLGSIVNLIIDPTTVITTDPDPETGSVEINCTVSKWTIVPVIPEA